MTFLNISALVLMMLALAGTVTNGLDVLHTRGLLRLLRGLSAVALLYLASIYSSISAGLVIFGDMSATLVRLGLIPVFLILAVLPMLSRRRLFNGR